MPNFPSRGISAVSSDTQSASGLQPMFVRFRDNKVGIIKPDHARTTSASNTVRATPPLTTPCLLVFQLLIGLSAASAAIAAHAQDQLVFVSGKNSGGRDLILASPDGRDRTTISQNPGSGHYPHFNWPAWSAEAELLAYMADTDGHDRYAIWTRVLDDNDAKRITPASTEALYPSWSPDGRRISFAARVQGTWEQFVIDADGSNLRKISDHGEHGIRPQWGGFSTWSRDGRTVYYHVRMSSGYAVRESDIQNHSTIVASAFPPGAKYPSLAPSGTAMAYLAPGADETTALEIRDIDNGTTRTVVTGQFTGTPSWSSDETQIALTLSEPFYNIAVVELSTGTVTMITNDSAFEGFPTWIQIARD